MITNNTPTWALTICPFPIFSPKRPCAVFQMPEVQHQSEEQRAWLLAEYPVNHLYQLKRKCNGCQEQDLSLLEGELVALLEDTDPLGSSSRWLVHTGGKCVCRNMDTSDASCYWDVQGELSYHWIVCRSGRYRFPLIHIPPWIYWHLLDNWGSVDTPNFLTLTSQQTRISPRSPSDVMVAGTSLSASRDGCFTTGPTPYLVSFSSLHLAEAPEIPAPCLEQTAVRCKQCYLEHKAFLNTSGYSETRTERCCLHVSVLSNNKILFMSSRKKCVYGSEYEVHASQTCLSLWD